MDDIRKDVYLFDITERYKSNSFPILGTELDFLNKAILGHIKILFIVHHEISETDKEQLIKQIQLPYKNYFDFHFSVIGVKHWPKTFDVIKDRYNILAVFDKNDYVIDFCKTQQIFACKI